MKKALLWLNDSLEEFLMIASLILMTMIMGIQVFSRYVLGASLSWSEELTRYIFVWAGFLSVSYCTKKCVSIKIEQFVAMFPRRGKAVFKLVNHTFELIFFFYEIPDVCSGERAGQPRLPDSHVLCAGGSAGQLSSGSHKDYAEVVHRASGNPKRI